jgi:hypothetical protein
MRNRISGAYSGEGEDKDEDEGEDKDKDRDRDEDKDKGDSLARRAKRFGETGTGAAEHGGV